MPDPAIGYRLEDAYSKAIDKVETHGAALEELESTLTALDPTVVQRYRKQYQEQGGEQFRPHAGRFSCKSCFAVSFNQAHYKTSQIPRKPKSSLNCVRTNQERILVSCEQLAYPLQI